MEDKYDDKKKIGKEITKNSFLFDEKLLYKSNKNYFEYRTKNTDTVTDR